MKTWAFGFAHAAALLICWMGLGAGASFAQVASTFDFNFSFSYALSAPGDYGPLDGSFTATGGAGNYTITSITGTLGGYNIQLLAPQAFAGNDNLLYYPVNPGYFTLGGVSFVMNGTDLNLYYSEGVYTITPVNALGEGGVYTGTVTMVGAPGPVPGVGLVSFGGLFLSGAAVRFRLCAALAKKAFGSISARLSPRLARPAGEFA